jgi:hypothetical protein
MGSSLRKSTTRGTQGGCEANAWREDTKGARERNEDMGHAASGREGFQEQSELAESGSSGQGTRRAERNQTGSEALNLPSFRRRHEEIFIR